MNKILRNAWIEADELAVIRGKPVLNIGGRGARLAPMAAALALCAGLGGAAPEVYAGTYVAGSCSGGRGTGPDGIVYPGSKNPNDGSGVWSNVIGCNADGGGFTGVQVLGFSATATGNAATAIGFAATAAIRSTAVGMQAGALAMGSTALGQWARATAAGSVAIGGNTSSNTAAAGAQASGLGAVAIAGESRAMGADSVAVGTRSQARRDGDVAIGMDSVADGTAGNFSAVAIGRGSSALGENSVALGNANRATGPGAVALGNSSAATGARALAVGDDANALAAQSLSLGADSVASNSGDVALGAGSATAAAVGTSGVSIAGRSYSFAGSAPASTVSVGSAGAERTITNVAAGRLGALSTDAVNGSQLQATNQAVNALGDRAVAYDGNAGDPKTLITLGGPASTDGGATGGTKITNLTRGAVSATSTDAVNGSQLYDTNQDVLRMGDTVTNLGGTVTNMGGTLTSLGDTVTNLGDTLTNLTGDTSQTNTDANGLGIRYARTNERGLAPIDAYAQGVGSTALGYNARSTADNALALGRDAQASHEGSVALGANAVANGATLAAPAYRSGAAAVAGASPVGEVSVGSVGAERRITNVAAGATDTDAVNVSQLKSVADNVGSLGDRAVVYDGKAGDPKTLITLAGPTSTDGGTTGGTKLTNLARGAVSATSTDAVNGSQLHDTNQDVLRMGDTMTNLGDTLTTMGDKFTNLTGDVNKISKVDNGLGIRYARTNESGLTEDDAYAQGVGSTALGYGARATADNALALGRDAVASQAGSVALGSGSVSARALAPTTGNLAIGSGGALVPFNTADLTLLGEVSVGHDGAYRQITNVADGTDQHDAVTLRQLTGAIGSLTTTGTQYFHANSAAPDSLATGVEAIAIGPQTVVNGDRGLGIGDRAVVDQSAPGGIALGQQARSTSADGIAMGTQALADAVQGVALGAGSKVIAGGGVALGAGSIAKVVGGAAGYLPPGADGAAVNATRSKLAALSVGDVDAGNFRQITGVAAGTVDSDAVNVSQLKALASNVSGLDAGGVKYDLNPDGAINYGMVTLNPGGSATVLRNVARAALSADSTDAVNGSQLFETNQYVKSIGDTVDNFTKGGGGIKYFHANGGASAMLPDSQAKGLGSIAMGPGAAANGGNSVALGNGAAAGQDGDVALGAGAVADRGAESYAGKYSDAQNKSAGTVSVGSAGAERTLSNLADGRQATDAVNLRQLDGALKQANDYTDKRLQEVAGNVLQVGDQLTALDERVTGVEGDVKNISNGAAGMFQTSQEEKAAKPPKASGVNSAAGGAGAVASGKNSTAIGNGAQASGAGATALGNGSKASGSNAVALGAGSVAERDNTVSVGAAGSERQIANVARGTAGTDAVNLNQLREIESGMNNQVAGLRKDVQGLDNRLSAGVASAMAMSALPQAYLPGRSMFSMGGGAWRGESGFAMGLSTVSDNGRWVVKGLASSTSRGDYGASVGVGYQW